MLKRPRCRTEPLTHAREYMSYTDEVEGEHGEDE